MLSLAMCTGVSSQRYLGGDISMLPTYKANGTVYRNSDGKAECPYKIFPMRGGTPCACVCSLSLTMRRKPIKMRVSARTRPTS